MKKIDKYEVNKEMTNIWRKKEELEISNTSMLPYGANNSSGN